MEKKNGSILDFSKVLSDINTKISASLDLIWRQLFTKYEGPACTHFEFLAKTAKNFSRAWQAYFLSYDLQIWWEYISFKDIQMVFNHDFDTSCGFQFGKKLVWVFRPYLKESLVYSSHPWWRQMAWGFAKSDFKVKVH